MDNLHALLTTLAMIALLAALAMAVLQLRRILDILRHKQSAELRLPFQNFAIAVAQHEDLASVYYRGLQGFTGLSAEEQVRFFMVATLVFNYWNDVYEQNQRGIIPVTTWDRVQRMMRDFVAYPGIREYWGFRRHWYSADVQKLIDEMMGGAGRNAPALYPEPSA